MSLEKALANLTGSSTSTPTDVAMSLLEKDKAIMRTHIKNIRTMNQIKVMEWYSRFKLGGEDNVVAEFWATLYDANIVHMVNDKRKGEQAVVKIGSALMAQLGMNPQENEKKGLFGGKK